MSSNTNIVYFVQAKRSLDWKIGITNDLPTRFLFLHNMVGGGVHMRAALYGTRETENQMHERFAATRLSGEWFADSPDINSLADLIGVPEDIRISYPPASAVALDAESRAVDRARLVADSLVDTFVRQSGCTTARAMTLVAEQLGIQRSALWALRYRPAKSIPAGLYQTLIEASDALARTKD